MSPLTSQGPFDSERDKSPSLYERDQKQIVITSKQTPSLSSIETLPVEIKILIFRHLDRQSDLDALKTTSKTFRHLYQHNVRFIQTAVILNSLRNDGSNLRDFWLCVKAAMSYSSDICIPFLQGMEAAYKEFHRLSISTHTHSHHHRHAPHMPSASQTHALIYFSPVTAYRRAYLYPRGSGTKISKEQPMFVVDWDTIINLAIKSLR